jgi:predicted nuclease of restriction endonuclease-like RecB superfamily
MLPGRLIDFDRTEDGRLVPRWLEPRDDVWLRELAAEAAAAGDRPVRDVDERMLEVVTPVAKRHGAGRRTVAAVWTIEKRRWTSRIDSPVAPLKIRRTVFRLAAERDREEAIATAAAELGVDETRIEKLLFADRMGVRLLVPPERAATEAELRDAYNLALVQSLLARATEVTANVRANLRHVVRHAKLVGLMATFSETEDGATRATLSGPLALFHDTVKYGNALARWFPSLVTTPGWSLEARVVLNGETSCLCLDASAPLPRTHALPRAHDSYLEARLETDLRRLALPWRVEREAAVVRARARGSNAIRLFFPDFALSSERGRALVEVVGYWTPEYLADKCTMLEAADTPIVLCVDARHARGPLAEHPAVVTFEKRVDAARLGEACERALASRGGP